MSGIITEGQAVPNVVLSPDLRLFFIMFRFNLVDLYQDETPAANN
jgi:hypothetical protein